MKGNIRNKIHIDSLKPIFVNIKEIAIDILIVVLMKDTIIDVQIASVHHRTYSFFDINFYIYVTSEIPHIYITHIYFDPEIVFYFNMIS